MTLIKEPKELDFLVESRPLTKEEEKIISNYIKQEKKKNTPLIAEPNENYISKKKSV